MRHRDCPVCGGRDSEVCYRQRFAVEDDGCRITGYDVVTCGACGAAFADGIPSQAALDRYYAVASKYEYLDRGGEAPAALGESHRAMVERLLALVPDTAARIVDVGCGNGDVLGLFRRAGRENLLGVDPAEHSGEAARRLYGIEVVTGSVLAMPAVAGGADLVMLSAVLEHVRRVGPALRQVADALATDGCVYVEVPDLERFSCDGSMPFQQFSVEHINYFTSASLAAAAAGVGLRLEESWTAARRTGVSEEPVLCGVFRRDPAVTRRGDKDETGAAALRRYVAQCESRERPLRERLLELTTAGDKLIVWGAGTHMQHLLAQVPEAAAGIVAIVDTNPRLQGVVVAGLPVCRPEDVAGRDEPILVGSTAYEHEIVAAARGRYGLHNRFLSLERPGPIA